MSSELEPCDPFANLPHRGSIESIDEDASPATAARTQKHPWKKSKSKSKEDFKIQSANRRDVTFDVQEETVDSHDDSVHGSARMDSSSEGTLQTLHQRDSSERQACTATGAVTVRRSKKTKEIDYRKKQSEDPIRKAKESRDAERRRRVEQNGTNIQSKNDVAVDGRDSGTTADVGSMKNDSCDTSKHDDPHLDSPNVQTDDYNPDDTFAHLLQMVASNDMLENGEKHAAPFTDENSKDSGSSEDFFALAYKGTDNTRESLHQVAMSPSDADEILDVDFPDDDASQAAARNFAVEHRIFMKSLLDLLSQRERYATEADINDKDTIKSGPLKKASHLVTGIWKVKYVEVRRGVFSYYEDEISKESEGGTLVRKNIPLHADTCSCRAVKVKHNALSVSPGGAIFELKIEGSPKRLWMANSREERQAWIHAIHAATLGKSVTQGERYIDHSSKSGNISDESPYKLDLDLYVKVQKEIQQASSKQSYLGSLSGLVGTKLNVPVQWIRQQIGGISTDHANIAFHEEAVSRGVNQLWKDLMRDSVRIDGELFTGGNGRSPEMIIGALMRYIIGFDQSSPLSANATVAQKHKFSISESQALSYARDILLAGNRTRSGGDSYFCVNTLCKSPELAVIVPSSLEAEPWTINFSHIQPEKRGRRDLSYSMNELSGWLKTRNRPQKPWKRRYFILSEGTLSHFERALPRPRGLRGQIAVADSTISVAEARKPDGRKGISSNEPDVTPFSKNFVVSIVGKDGFLERQILFEDERKFILWTHSLEAYCMDDEMWKMHNSLVTVRGMFQKLWEITGSQEPFGDFILGHKSLKENAGELGLDSEEVSSVIASATNSGAAGRATVLVSVEASTDYKVCTVDPQGDDADDTWA